MRDLTKGNVLNFEKDPQMAKSTQKVEDMSAEREVEENGEVVNGFLTFTLKAVHDDYDIVVQVQPDAISGCDVGSILRLAQRSYSHVLSNEAASAGINRDQEKFPNLDGFLRQWRQNKRQQIVSGEYTTRQVGPRISPEEKEWIRLIDEELLKPRVLAAGIAVFPTSGKAEIQGKTLNEWREYCKQSAKYAELKTRAAANVAATRAKAEQAKASGGNAFADL